MVLRLLVDTPEGITIDECEAVNNYLGEMLDSENVMEGHYVLEVASPGLDRHLSSDRDLERVLGKDLSVNMYEPVDGKRSHEGKLVGFNKDEVVIEAGGISTVIPRAKIAVARLKIEF
jgi:ribosome maturation factor RimP